MNTQRRSGAVAAVLSFIFPGLGQAYLGRKREALIFAVPLLALFFGVVAWVVSTGLTRAGARLLDPTVAGIAAIVSAVVVVWWAAAVLTAWRAGYHSSPATVAVPVALVAILFMASVYDRVPLGASWLYSISVADHGFDGGLDCTIQDCNTGDGLPTPTNGTVAQIPTGTASPHGSATFGPTPSSTPTSTDDEYAPDATEPPASIEPGPSPSFDITKIDAQDDGWLNVLLLGLDTRCAGGLVTGANTDSMIVVSANAATGQVYMFSFPRDIAQFPLYVGGTMPGYWKLNTFAGYTKGYPDTFPNPGQPALAYEIGFLIGMPIDYYASINICGFPQLIDELGGVDICNSKAIDDPSYPWGDGTTGYQLATGPAHLNGANALAYARSRHGSSDFARARRQQQLLTAIRQSLLTPQNLARLPDIITAMGDIVHTNFPPDQIDQLLQLANQIQSNPTGQYVFSFPGWAQHLPRLQTNGRSVEFLDMDKIAALSDQVFGNKSQYWTNGPLPSVQLPQPAPSDTPVPGGTQC
jgi:LCP family protein required for cell wall assembly